MITIIGKDNTRMYKEGVNKRVKCRYCGTIFTATLDDFTLTTIGDEYKLKINCPACLGQIFYSVEED